MSMISKKDRLEITNSWLLDSSEYKEYRKCYEDLKLYVENAVESNLTKEQRLAWDEVRSDMDLEDLAKTQEFYLDLEFLSGISKKSRGDLTTILVNGRKDKSLDTQAQVFSSVDFNNGCVKIKEDLPFMFRPYAIDADKIKASYPEFYKGLCKRAGNYVDSLKKINRKLEKIFDLLTCNTTLELISKNLKPSSSISEIESLLSKDEKDAELLGTLITRADKNSLRDFYSKTDSSRYFEFLESVHESHISKIGDEIKKLWNEYILYTCPALGELYKASPSLCSTSQIITYYPTQILGKTFRDFLRKQMGKPLSRAYIVSYDTIRVKYSEDDGLVVKKDSMWSRHSGFGDWIIKNKTDNDLESLRELTVDYYKEYQKILDNSVLYQGWGKEGIILRDKEGKSREVKTYKDLLDIDEATFDMICNENGWAVNKKVSTVGNIPLCNSKREELITLCTERIKDWVN